MPLSQLYSHILWTDEAPTGTTRYSQPAKFKNSHSKSKRGPVSESPELWSENERGTGGINAKWKTESIIMDKGMTVDRSTYKRKMLSAYEKLIENQKIFPIPRKVIFMQEGALCHT